MTDTLKALVKAERAAWARMMRGTETDACTLVGQEGINYKRWLAAADAERAYREAHK